MEPDSIHLPQPVPLERSILWKPRYDSYYILAGVMRSAGGDYKTFFTQRALATVEGLVRSSPARDRFGFLTGRLFSCPKSGEHYMTVETIVPAPLPSGDDSQPSDEPRESIPTNLSAGHAVLGWYRTRPSAGSRLLDEDALMHKEFFPDPWQIALILVPSGERPSGSVFRLERKVSRSYIAPFFELLQKRPRRDESTKSTCLVWPNYLSDDEVIPLEDWQTLSDADSLVEPSSNVQGDPALDWLEEKLRSLWSRIRGAARDGRRGGDGADHRETAALVKNEPVAPVAPSLPRPLARRVTPTRPISPPIFSPSPLPPSPPALAASVPVSATPTPARTSSVPTLTSGDVERPDAKPVQRVPRQPPAKSPTPASSPLARSTPPRARPAVLPNVPGQIQRSEMVEQIKSALSHWEPEAAAGDIKGKVEREPSIQPPLPSAPTVLKTEDRLSRTGSNERSEKTIADKPDMWDAPARLTAPVPSAANSAPPPLLLIPADFEQRRTRSFVESHKRLVMVGGALGMAAIVALVVWRVSDRISRAQAAVTREAPVASTIGAQTPAANPVVAFGAMSDSLENAITFYRNVDADFAKRRLGCRALSQSRMAVVERLARLASQADLPQSGLGAKQLPRYDRLKKAVAEVERSHARSGCAKT